MVENNILRILSKDTDKLFTKAPCQFCVHYIKISGKELFPKNSFSFHIYELGSMSWLDHAVTSSDMHSVIYHMEIGYGNAQEDRMPVLMDCCVSELPSLIQGDRGQGR